METVADRILSQMTKNGIKQVDLIRETGLSKGTISKWIAGTNIPSGKNVSLLANALKVDTHWLLTGEDENYESEYTADRDVMLQVAFKKMLGQPLDKPLDLSEVSDESLRKLAESFGEIDDWDSNTPLPDDEVEIPFFKDFQMSCGSGNIGEALKTERRKLRFSKLTLNNAGVQKQSAIAVTAHGRSMHPVIMDKATVFLDTSRTAIKDGKIFAMSHGGLFKIKYLYALPLGGVRIVSENSDEYPEERLTAQDIIDQEFHIIGQVFNISTMLSL